MDTAVGTVAGTLPRGRSPWRQAVARLHRDKLAMAAATVLTLYVVLALAAPILQRTGLIDPYTLHNDLLRPQDAMPAGGFGGVSAHHPFGVEPQTGRDVLARIVSGLTQSMLISVCATLLSLLLGTTIGIISGYAGGRVDFVLGRVMDLVLAFPALLMLLTLSVVLIQRITSLGVPAGAPSQIVYLILVLGFFGFPFIARIVRGQVLSLREREFVQAARAVGARQSRIWFKELLPNLWPPLLVFGTLILPGNVSAEAALSFLGVGVPPPTPTLGNILTDSVSYLSADPVFFALPGLAIFGFVLSANLLGDTCVTPSTPSPEPLPEGVRMMRGTRGLALAGLIAVIAASCGGTSSDPAGSAKGTQAVAGGTLYYLTKRVVEHYDPQRTFTLRPDIKWQDGSSITCEDFRYGVSRTFATDVITGGPNYAIQFLDIPSDAKGGSKYKGPYVKDAAGQALYDKAVTCAGSKLTFNLKKPVGDFNYTVTMPAFAPYKKEQDKGDRSNYSVFSSGPYKLEGAWEKGKGGTFVRNDQWQPDGIRKALPDKIVFTEGLADEVIAQRLISDSGDDKYAVSDRQVPPAMRPQVKSAPSMKSRYEIVDAPYVDYLVPNFKKMTDPLVRQALLVATSKSGWVAATGGTDAGKPTQSIINPSVVGYKEFNAFGVPDAGDPAKARQLLTQAGVKLPYPITLTYSGGTPTSAKAASALKEGWQQAGFSVSLNELTDTYYDVIQNPANSAKFDVTWASWGADWPSASTVVPALFDSRVNLSAASTGQDYGYYANDEINKAIDRAYATTDLDQQAKQWGELDERLAKDLAYLPLRTQKFFLLWGSGVKGWVDNPSMSNFPDLGSLGVK